MTAETFSMIAMCALWFGLGYIAFQARIVAKEVKDVVRLRNIFVHNDVVIRVYGDEGDPDVYRVSHDISTLLKCMKEKNEQNA